MHEIDLIPASYRRERSQLLWLKGIAALVIGLVMTTAGARVWLDAAFKGVDAEVTRLQAQQTITGQERDRLQALTEERKNYQDQLYLLKGLRSGAATTDLFGIIDQALVGDEVWFRSWEFRRAGVTNAEGQSVETGYFVVVPSAGQQSHRRSGRFGQGAARSLVRHSVCAQAGSLRAQLRSVRAAPGPRAPGRSP